MQLGSLGPTWIILLGLNSTYLRSLGFTGTFYSPLEFTYSHTTQWKRQRRSCKNGEGGKASMTFGVHLRLTEAPRPRAHDTNRYHGYKGGLPRGELAPPAPITSTPWRIVFYLHKSTCCAIVQVAWLRASWLAADGKVSCADRCHQCGKTRTSSPPCAL